MKVNKKGIIEEKILQNQGIIQIADIIAEGISKQYAMKDYCDFMILNVVKSDAINYR